MAILSNDKSVFGDVVPAIYINRITLENGNLPLYNPMAKDRIVAHTDNKATTGVGGADFYEQYYEEGSHPVYNDKTLKIVVDYVVKDGIDG